MVTPFCARLRGSTCFILRAVAHSQLGPFTSLTLLKFGNLIIKIAPNIQIHRKRFLEKSLDTRMFCPKKLELKFCLNHGYLGSLKARLLTLHLSTIGQPSQLIFFHLLKMGLIYISITSSMWIQWTVVTYAACAIKVVWVGKIIS